MKDAFQSTFIHISINIVSITLSLQDRTNENYELTLSVGWVIAKIVSPLLNFTFSNKGENISNLSRVFNFIQKSSQIYRCSKFCLLREKYQWRIVPKLHPS